MARFDAEHVVLPTLASAALQRRVRSRSPLATPNIVPFAWPANPRLAGAGTDVGAPVTAAPAGAGGLRSWMRRHVAVADRRDHHSTAHRAISCVWVGFCETPTQETTYANFARILIRPR
jgi:hypothetical protein